jgi:hypothetical protein
MHANIDVWITFSIDDDKTVSLTTLGEFVTDRTSNQSYSNR